MHADGGWMRRGKRLGLITLLVALAVGYAVTMRPWEEKPAIVASETLVLAPVTQLLALNGRVAAEKSVTVRSAVSAQATAILADEGDRVQAGDVIVTLDTALAEADVSQARAALEAQQAKELQAEGALARARALGSIGPRGDLDDAVLALEAAEKDSARLKAALDQAQEQLSQYTVKAPITGVVLTRNVDPGQRVDTQTELFSIADLATLVVETDVDELYSARIHEGLKALMKPIGAPETLDGRVIFAAPNVDSATGGRQIKVAFDRDVDLPVGLTVNLNVIVSETEAALSVPRSAILLEGGKAFVLVIAEGRAERREIRFDDWPSERVIVTDGLTPGDVVILDPAKVTPGDMVQAS